MGWLLVWLTLAGPPTTANEKPWIKVDSDDGLTVWNRDVPGSGIREVRAQAILPVAAAKIWRALEDVAHYVEFMPYVEEAFIIGNHPTGHYEYQLVDPPLVDRRDYTVKIDITKDVSKGEYERRFVSANQKGPPEQEDVVRVKISTGSWHLKALGPNKTEVTYHVYTNPGGSIPLWIANKANTVAIPDLFESLKNRAKDPAWTR